MPLGSPILRFGPYEFLPAQQQLRQGAKSKTLTKSMNQLLLLLVSRPGELVTREEIADTLWATHGTIDTNTGINTAIKRLRTTIGDNNGHGVFIETVVGVGYRFAAPVTASEPETAEPEALETVFAEVASEALQNTPKAAQTTPKVLSRNVLLTAAIAVALLLSVSAAGIWHKSHHFQTTTPSPTMYTSVMEPITADDLGDELSAQTISPSGKLLAFSDIHGLFVRTLATGITQKLNAPPRLTRISWFPDETTLLVSSEPLSQEEHTAIWSVPLQPASPQKILDDATLGTVSPDGKSIAFLRTSATEIWLANSNGTNAHRLVQTSNNDTFTALLWSPRGDRIIVDRFISRSLLPTVDTPKTDVSEPQHDSHDNVYQSYRAQTGSLLAEHPAKQFHSAVLLPNGTMYYPIVDQNPIAQVAVVQTDSSTGAFEAEPSVLSSKETLFSDFTAAEQISASADGKTLSAILNRPASHVYTADLARSTDGHLRLQNEKRISWHTYNTLPMSWSRDGKMIISDEGFLGPISVIGQTLDGSQTKVFAGSTSFNRFAQGRFSPDGKWLLYLRFPPDGGGTQSIERVPAEGGAPHTVPTRGQLTEFRCSTSEAGRCVLRQIENKKVIIFYDLDPIRGMGQELARIPWQENFLGDWSISPDGKTIATTSHDPAHPSVQLLTIVDKVLKTNSFSTLHEIPVPGFGTVLGPAWTVDGDGLFVHTYAADGYSLLYLDMAGAITLLRQSPALIWAVQSPDGKKIAFPLDTATNRNVWVGTTRLGLSH